MILISKNASKPLLVFLFSLALGAQSPGVIYTFDPEDADINSTIVDPASPAYSGIIAQGRDGNLYSTTPSGGRYGLGTVFQITPAGVLTVLHDFTGGLDGANPNGGLTLGRDGNFYGTAKAGGAMHQGTAFSITPSGSLNCVQSFTTTNGAFPLAPPVEGPDANFYGTAQQGGPHTGVIYKMTPACVITQLYGFPSSAAPTAPLVLASDGLFYGTTVSDGTAGLGTVFRMTLSGAVTVVYSFDNIHGAQPIAPVIQGLDGSLYGTTYAGGANNLGVVFQLTRGGSINVLHTFSGADGSQPQAGLLQATDGSFYGVTTSGGNFQHGVLFRVTTQKSFFPLFNFQLNTPWGWGPQVSLVQHTNGLLYGETFAGGIAPAETGEVAGGGQGTFYSLNRNLKPFVSLMTTSGTVGAKVEILGQGFLSATAVSFNGSLASFHYTSDNHLIATVPGGAVTGPVTVTISTGNLVSSKHYRVVPTIVSFSPTSGMVGTDVVITGTGLTQASQATFGGVTATSLAVNSSTQVTATVPVGARTGKIAVTTAGGTALSSGTFTVLP